MLLLFHVSEPPLLPTNDPPGVCLCFLVSLDYAWDDHLLGAAVLFSEYDDLKTGLGWSGRWTSLQYPPRVGFIMIGVMGGSTLQEVTVPAKVALLGINLSVDSRKRRFSKWYEMQENALFWDLFITLSSSLLFKYLNNKSLMP